MTKGNTAAITEIMAAGGRASRLSSAREGFLPIPIKNVPIEALAGIAIHLRTADRGETSDAQGPFALYRSVDVPFTEQDRARLMANGVRFLYIPIADQRVFREQIETRLTDMVHSPTLAVSEVSALIYETSVELVNELLADPDYNAISPRLERVSRAVTTLVIDNASAFAHLFTASYHDFYTATHMVNVATWMVPVAYTVGYTDPDELTDICKAGLLHDIGKVYVSEQTLNKHGPLSDEEWELLKTHTQRGLEHLDQFESVPGLVKTVCHQHHERLDGSGYPLGLRADQIHPISRICALVDSFDAMTAFRPFKEQTLSVSQAVDILKQETPNRYDPRIVEAWLALLGTVAPVQDGAIPAGVPALSAEGHDAGEPRPELRQHPRSPLFCPARVHVLEKSSTVLVEGRGVQVVAHNISRGGMAFLTQMPIPVGQLIRVYLHIREWSRHFLEGECVRCHSYREGWYQVGMRFTRLPQ
ncbi:MAG: HD domain-containing protein [Phycisphaerales bacterium]|nr:MAG: HD domain-containing protein [Phycisphaerales bacterium]